MRRQILVIMNVAMAFFLIGTMFSTNLLAIGGKPNPIWEAIYDLQAKVNSLNVTVIEQQAQIAELQTCVNALNATKLGKPDYDSGWKPLPQGGAITFAHGLGTTNILVCIIGRNYFIGINHMYYGGDHGNDRGAYWQQLTENSIEIVRQQYDSAWDEVRVMLWKITQP